MAGFDPQSFSCLLRCRRGCLTSEAMGPLTKVLRICGFIYVICCHYYIDRGLGTGGAAGHMPHITLEAYLTIF